MGNRESSTPTPYRVHCYAENRGYYLTRDEYMRQMMRANARWECPVCGNTADWDDDNYERAMDEEYEARMLSEGGPA